MIKIAAIILGILFVSNSSPVFAAQNIVFNEFLPHPATGDDWIEIYNPSSSTVNLSGYKINDSTSQVKELTGSVGPRCYLVVDVSNRLNNGGDSIYLLDSTGAQLDSKSYSADPGVDVSWQRQPDGGDWQTSSNITRELSNSGSSDCHGSESNQASQNSQSVNIELSEFMPNPSDGSEWVEIRNKNNYSSDIGGYQIDDIEGGSSPFTIPSQTMIASGGFWLLELSSSKFNNDADSIRLISPSGQVLEKFDYTSTTAGYSYAKNQNGSWQETTTPTKNSANQISSPGQDQTAEVGSTRPQSSIVQVASKSSPVASQVLGTKNVATQSVSESGNTRTSTYPIDSQEGSKDAQTNNQSSNSNTLGLIVIFCGIAALGVVVFVLKRRGIFDRIGL